MQNMIISLMVADYLHNPYMYEHADILPLMGTVQCRAIVYNTNISHV